MNNDSLMNYFLKIRIRNNFRILIPFGNVKSILLSVSIVNGIVL